MNPTWHPPEDAEQFIHEVKEKARHHEDAQEQDEIDRHSEALESVSVGVQYLTGLIIQSTKLFHVADCSRFSRIVEHDTLPANVSDARLEYESE